MKKYSSRTSNTISLAVAALLMAAVAPRLSLAQVNDVEWIPTGVGNYNTGGNWSPFSAVPTESFNEVAIINNGGTAELSAAAAASPGGIILGQADALGGALHILAGGSITTVDNGTTDGNVIVGDGTQSGVLTIDRGGSLTTELLSTFPAGESAVNLGGGVGPGNATLVSAAAVLRGDTRVIGNNVSFTTSSLQFGSGGQANLIAEITGASHSALVVNGPAQISDTLTVEFSGFSPSIGTSWTVVDADAIVGNFTDVVGNAALPAGQGLDLEKVTSGGGTQINVSLENVLTLSVNRGSGQTTIQNDSGSSIAFNSYTIQSPSGALNTGGWNSLANQVGGFQEANPTSNSLSELNPSSNEVVAGNGGTIPNGGNIGAAYSQIVPAFGTPIDEDLTFTYRRDDGREISGRVEYEGDLLANNLVLTIDPATGNGRITNDSLTSLNINAYSIGSTSGSLLTTWDSLQDQGDADWQEANPSANRVSELEGLNPKPLAAGAFFDLDGLWNTATGVQDVSDLELLFNDTAIGELVGAVVFDTIPAVSPGDFDADGDVDIADLVLWQRGGSPIPFSAADLASWEANFTGSSVAAISGVPEPASMALITAGLCGLPWRRRA